MDQTLDDIKEYIDRFILLPDGILGVLVTHIDLKKEWEEKDLVEACRTDFGIEDVVFSQNTQPGNFIQRIHHSRNSNFVRKGPRSTVVYKNFGR